MILTLGGYLVYWPVYQLVRNDTTRRQSWRNRYMRWWARGVCRIFRIQVRVEGTPPEAPFFLVSNHLSYLDILPLFLTTRSTFVAKQEVRHWPVLGYMVHTMGVLFVDRKRRTDVLRVNQLIGDALTGNQGLVLFPEGTTSGGDRVFPFKPSLLEIPARSDQPVHVAAIRYETDKGAGDLPAEQSICFYGGREPIHKHLVKAAGNRNVRCTIRFGESTVSSSDRKQLAEKMREEVEKIFVPMK